MNRRIVDVNNVIWDDFVTSLLLGKVGLRGQLQIDCLQGRGRGSVGKVAGHISVVGGGDLFDGTPTSQSDGWGKGYGMTPSAPTKMVFKRSTS